MSSNPELHRARLEHLNSHHDPSYLNGQIKAPSDFPQTGSLGQGRALEERGGTSGIPDSFHGVGPAAGPSRNGMARENGFARPTLPLLANLQSKGQVSSAGMSAEQGSLVASSHENASGAASGLKDSSPQAQNGLSAKARGKARQVDQNIPMEVLEAELPVEDEGLVPLAHIIERMANYGYEALQNLGETLPTLSSDERRRAIFGTALETRKHLIKLLVLAQWSRSSADLQKAMNIIGFLMGQDLQIESAIEHLTETRSILPNARMRNFDISTAIDVLGTGSYQRLPTSIKETFVPPAPLTDAEVASTLQELDEVLRIRLAGQEVVPVEMSSYHIADGRVWFSAQNLFEAAATVAGDESEDRWYLLHLKFDIDVTGQGKDLFPVLPVKQRRDRLLALANEELAPRESESSQSVAQQEVEAAAASAKNSVGTKGAPLIRMYNLLQELSLSYQLEILHYQANQLAKVGWGSSLQVSMEQNPQTLVVGYWAQERPSKAPKAPNPAFKGLGFPLRGGTIRITIEDRKALGGTEAVLASIFSRSAMQSPGTGDATGKPAIRQRRLLVSWDVDASVSKELVQDSLSISAHDLNIESFMLDVVHRHADAALRVFHRNIQRSVMARNLRKHDCVLRSIQGSFSGRGRTFLDVKLHGRHHVAIEISALDGRPQLRACDSGKGAAPLAASGIANQPRDARLRAASEQLHDNPHLLVDILQKLRLQAILDDVEQKAAYLGLSCQRRLPLRQGELAKLGPTTASFLFIQLAQCPNYALVLEITEQSLRTALICVAGMIEGGQPSMAIHSIEWLDRARIVARSAGTSHLKRKRGQQDPEFGSRLDMTIDELSALQLYGVALVGYFKIEQQLQRHSIPFAHVGPFTSAPSPPSPAPATPAAKADVTIEVPSLCLHARNLVEGAQDFVHQNVSLKLCDWWDRAACRVEISAKFRSKAGMSSRHIVSGATTIDYDHDSSILTFTMHNIETCISRLVAEWKRIGKLATLAKVVRSLGKKQKMHCELRSFDLSTVTFAYAKGMTASITWRDQVMPQWGQYTLEFFSDVDGAIGESSGNEESQENPQSVMAHAFERILNSGKDSGPSFWANFIKLLHDTLPLHCEIAPLYNIALEDAESPDVEIESATWFRLHYFDRYSLEIRCVQGSKILFYDSAQPLFKTQKLDHEAAHGNQGKGESQSAQPDADADADKKGLSDSQQHSITSDPPPPPTTSSLQQPIDVLEHSTHQHLQIPSFDRIVAQAISSFYQNYEPAQPPQALPSTGGADANAANAASSSAPSSFALLHPSTTRSPPVVDLHRAILCDASEEVVRPLLRLLDQAIRAAIR